MKWKEIYNKCNHKMYCRITEIKKSISINSNFRKYYNNNKVLFIIIVLVMFALVCIAFHSSFMQFIVAIVFILFIFILFFYNNTYNIKFDNEGIKINYGTNKYEILFDNLLNMYLDKHRSKYFVFISEYTINIIFKQDNEQMILSLPTYLLSKNDVFTIMNNCEYVELKQQAELEKKNKEHKNMIKAMIITIGLVLIAFFIAAIIVVLIKK